MPPSDPTDHAESDRDAIEPIRYCPRCGTAISAFSVHGPGIYRIQPCGHRVAHETPDTLPTEPPSS
jgi:hypothetical protein